MTEISLYVTGSDKSGSTATLSDFQGSTDVITQIVTQSKKYATFENNCFTLNGSWDCQGNSLSSLMSDTLSDSDKKFTANPKITITFSSEKDMSKGITIDFTDVYCTGFIIKYYSSTDTILLTKTVTDNNQRFYVLADSITSVKKVTVEITATSKNGRYARISNIEFGARIVFTDNDIIKSDIVDQADPMIAEIPESQLNFTVISNNDSFAITNPSGVYAYLRDNLPVTITCDGKEKGRYYLSKWKQTAINTYEFTATDVIGYLKNKWYNGSEIMTNKSFADVVADILSVVGASISYSIDNNITAAISGYIVADDCIKSLQTLLTVVNVYIYADGTGKLHFAKPFVTTDTTETFLYGEMLGEPTIQQSPIVDGYSVEYTTAEYGEAESFTVSFACAETVMIDFSEYEKSDYVCTSYTVTGYTVTSDEKRIGSLVLNGTGTGTGSVLITCKQITTVTGRARKSIVQGKRIDMSGNTLITSLATAKTVGDNRLLLYENRLLFKFTVEYNADIYVGQYIAIKDQYNNTVKGTIQAIRTDIAEGLLQEIEVTGKNV